MNNAITILAIFTSFGLVFALQPAYGPIETPLLDDRNYESLVQEEQAIPAWVDANFKWYGQEKISQKELLNSLKYLIDKNILFLSDEAAKEVAQLRAENAKMRSIIGAIEKDKIPLHTPEWTDLNESDPGQTTKQESLAGMKQAETKTDEIMVILYPAPGYTGGDKVAVMVSPASGEIKPNDEILVILRPSDSQDQLLVGTSSSDSADTTHKKWIDILSMQWDSKQTSLDACPKIYLPVCGADGNTYSNECMAQSAGIEIKHDGECSNVCPQVYQPVCGADGRTYPNYCEIKQAGIETKHVGKCTTESVCPKVYDPVCGIDGITYENQCLAEKSGVKIDYTGACEGMVCTQIYEPVCGSDGSTYSNSCFAKKAGVEVKHQGQCESCPKVYDPVCGVDQTTYPNACEAKKAGAEVKHKGECTTCPDVYKPVCGTDGITYANSCEATNAGVSIAHEGECQARLGSGSQ